MYHLYTLPSLLTKMKSFLVQEAPVNDERTVVGVLFELTRSQLHALGVMVGEGGWFDVDRLAQHGIAPATATRLVRSGSVEVRKISGNGRKLCQWRAVSDGLGHFAIRPDTGTVADAFLRRLKAHGHVQVMQDDSQPLAMGNVADKVMVMLQCVGWPISKIGETGYILRGYRVTLSS